MRVPRRHEAGRPNSQVHPHTLEGLMRHIWQRWSTVFKDTPIALVWTRLGPGSHWRGLLCRLPARWPVEIRRFWAVASGLDALARFHQPRRVVATRRRHASASTPHTGLAGGSALHGFDPPRARTQGAGKWKRCGCARDGACGHVATKTCVRLHVRDNDTNSMHVCVTVSRKRHCARVCTGCSSLPPVATGVGKHHPSTGISVSPVLALLATPHGHARHHTVVGHLVEYWLRFLARNPVQKRGSER